MIVDDNEVNLVLFDALVKKIDGAEGICFAAPKQALGWASTNVCDLLIVDYMMPEMDGLEFITEFKAIQQQTHVPILMITANDQKQIRYRALDSGATDFLTKPVDKVEFLARVKNMLTVSEARRSLLDRAAWLADEVRKATDVIVQRERETVMRLCRAAEFRDPETGAHILRMAHFSRIIAARMGMSVAEQDLLLEAAPMHDIGKVGIADNILLKPGKLAPDEFEIMKQHAVIGYRLLQGSSSRTLQVGAEIALGHHEKWDGSGYPGGLKGESIPIFSRIVAVADVFDALTSERPYKKAWSVEDAVSHVKNGAGGHFDPRVVEAFLASLSEVHAIREQYKDDA
ncbi:response regulator [Curvibacter sp. APW13]|uniref:HD domain-containing phosphohydrolase n=1 Tax=Curvibacter sp. APW13 TaxID=3077236 RepID=UPI0028E05B87|nr:HD domain-containing phosphohydrolase [Curvibacter sp. APW13]MDT8991246.1 response regulator [Curvibacter sp. APW13]